MSDIVERLRTVVSDLADEAADEIERLRGQLRETANQSVRSRELDIAQIKGQRQRIAELEKLNSQLIGEIGGDVCGHIITDAQIDAAWAKRVLIPSADNDDSANTYIPIKPLGIERCGGCEECEGDGWYWKEEK